MTAAERILQKALVASKLKSSEWSGVQAGLRDRAFFSATVEEARILHEARECAAKIADGHLSGSEARVAIRQILAQTGHPDADKPGESNLRNLSSRRRLDLIMDQNVRESRGFVRYKEGMSDGALAAFPAQELLRIRSRENKRDWATKWHDAGGKFFDGRMIALKTDPIWTKISRFGHPWPPFDFNSGMGVRDVSRADAIRLGVIKKDDPPPKMPKQKGMNDDLETKVTFTRNDPEWKKLSADFGDQIQMKGNVVKWRGEVVRENFDPGAGHNFRMKLGVPSESLVSLVEKGVNSGKIEPKFLSTLLEFQKKGENGQLIFSQNNLNKKREDGKTDHRVHFRKMEEYPTSTPLEVRDIELIPSIWRNPSRVIEGEKGGLIIETDTLDGDKFRIVVGVLKPVKDEEGNETLVPLQFPKERTYYRTK